MPDLTIEKVEEIVQQQLEKITDTSVRDALSALLVTPSCHDRDWFYGGPPELTFPCWSIAEDLDSDTLYVYCEEGFGPKTPWGLVSMSGNEMGMDSGWFRTLERAFYDSFASAPLPVWRVIKRDAPDNARTIATNLTLDEAHTLERELVSKLDPADRAPLTYAVEPRTQKWR